MAKPRVVRRVGVARDDMGATCGKERCAPQQSADDGLAEAVDGPIQVALVPQRDAQPVVGKGLRGELDGLAEMVDGPEGRAGILIDDQRDTEAFIVCLEEAMEAMLSRDTRAQYADVARELGKHSDMTAVAHSYQEIYQDLFNDRAGMKNR